MSETKNCRNCPVWKRSLFQNFNDELLSYLENVKTQFHLKKGEHLFHQNSPVTGLYCHASGLSKVVQRDLASEKIRFTRLVYPSDTSGHRSIFIDSTYKGSCQAISEEAQVCHIPTIEVLYFLSKNPSFAQNLIIKISTELNHSEEEKMATKERTVRSRLALLLHNLALQYSEEINSTERQIKSEITKREIASLLLVADETIIRLMSEMQKEGLIRYEDKFLVISNLEELLKQTRY